MTAIGLERFPPAIQVSDHQHLVEGGARVSGAVADAIIELDQREHRRRIEAGLAGIDDLGILDALMCLPLDAAVPIADLSARTLRHLKRAPAGTVDWLPCASHVRRVVVPACSVPLVMVRAGTWRSGLRRAAHFEPFARRIVLLTRAPKDLGGCAWEADAAGVGLWVDRRNSAHIEQVVPAAPFILRYVKPARWWFQERAYSAWSSGARPDESQATPPRN